MIIIHQKQNYNFPFEQLTQSLLVSLTYQGLGLKTEVIPLGFEPTVTSYSVVQVVWVKTHWNWFSISHHTNVGSSGSTL